MTTYSITRADLRAIDIAVDELEAYVETVGAEDESHEIQAWAVKRLRALQDRIAERVEMHGEGERDAR